MSVKKNTTVHRDGPGESPGTLTCTVCILLADEKEKNCTIGTSESTGVVLRVSPFEGIDTETKEIICGDVHNAHDCCTDCVNLETLKGSSN